MYGELLNFKISFLGLSLLNVVPEMVPEMNRMLSSLT